MSAGNKLALAGAMAVTALAGSGIVALIALDLLGEELVVKLWRSASAEPARPAVSSPVLENARDITFFTTVEAKEHGVAVTTGVTFSTIADLLAAKQKERWCYVMASPRGGLTRRIGLGKQAGMAPPVYDELSGYPAEELAAIGLSAGTLQTLAKTHCRFAKATVQPPRPKKGEGQT